MDAWVVLVFGFVHLGMVPGEIPRLALDRTGVAPLGAPASTLAGNLIIVGSVANIIVVDQAARLGVRIGRRQHPRVGVPVTLAIAAGWLALVVR